MIFARADELICVAPRSGGVVAQEIQSRKKRSFFPALCASRARVETCRKACPLARIADLNSRVAKQEATIVQQQKGMEVLTAQLKEQAAQIQKVSAQLEVSKPATQVVVNKP